MLQPENHKHTLWGALVGGPDSKDQHKDVTTDYVYNEVAIDYNAAFVGALAGHYLLYEQEDVPLSQFPILEPSTDEHYAEATLEQENNERTQITITIHNETVHPPRLENDMVCRYYFNIKELFDAGQTIDDVSFQIMYDEQKTSFGGETICTGPIKADDGGTYYVEFAWKDQNIYGDRDIHFALVAEQDATWKAHWDSSNDWSRKDITSTPKKSSYIPVFFVNGQLVYGGIPEPEPPYNHGGGSQEKSYTYAYTEKKQNWESGFVGSLTITNTGNVALSQWQITFSMEADIDEFWTANLIQSNNPHYTIEGKDFNSSILPGEFITLEFIGSYNDGVCELEDLQLISD